MQLKNAEEVFVYVGVKDCGCGEAVVVDKPEYKDEIQGVINYCLEEGLHIERMPLEAGKALMTVDCSHSENDGSSAVPQTTLEAAGQQRMFER